MSNRIQYEIEIDIKTEPIPNPDIRQDEGNGKIVFHYNIKLPTDGVIKKKLQEAQDYITNELVKAGLNPDDYALTVSPGFERDGKHVRIIYPRKHPTLLAQDANETGEE